MYRRSLVQPDNMQVAPQPTRAQPAGTPPSTFLFLPIHMSNSPEQQSPTSSHTARRRQYSPPDIDLGCTTPTMPLSCRGAPCRRAAARRVCPVYRTTRDSLSSAKLEKTGRRCGLPRRLSATPTRTLPHGEGHDRSAHFPIVVLLRFLQAWQRPTLPSLET